MIRKGTRIFLIRPKVNVKDLVNTQNIILIKFDHSNMYTKQTKEGMSILDKKQKH